MSDINPTRRADEPPARDGAPLAGWPTAITAEEAVALQVALKQLQTALDAVVRDRDEARAEVERLRKAHEAAHRQLQADLDTAIRQRDKARARALKLWAVLEMVRDADNDCRVDGLATIPDVARRSIDEALDDAEVERLRADAANIATIAHSGGLTGLSEAEALVAIRRLTLRAWADRHSRTGSRQVRSALEAQP